MNVEPTVAEIETAARALRAADGALDVAAVMHTYDGDAHAALAAALPLVEARLTTCDCDASRDGIDFHQGYCRSLSTDEKRARWVAQAARTSQVIHERNEFRELADAARLLGPARRVLDRVAEGEVTRAECADMAQRIVDLIGHPVTDEPPHALVELERLRAIVRATPDGD